MCFRLSRNATNDINFPLKCSIIILIIMIIHFNILAMNCALQYCNRVTCTVLICFAIHLIHLVTKR